MSEINLNGVGGSLGVGRALNSAGSQKSTAASKVSVASDSAEFSNLPDLSTLDESVESEFEALRSRLQNSADSELYPPLDTIDKLAAMLAIEINPSGNKSQ